MAGLRISGFVLSSRGDTARAVGNQELVAGLRISGFVLSSGGDTARAVGHTLGGTNGREWKRLCI